MTSPDASSLLITQRTADLLRLVLAPTAPALMDALRADGWDVGGRNHAHTYQGSKLVHSHPAGDVEHGYYGHPEDISA